MNIEREALGLPLESYWWSKLSPEAMSELLMAMYKIGCLHGHDKYIAVMLENLPWMTGEALIRTIRAFDKKE